MCGIIGVFGRKDSLMLVKQGISVLKNRGRDGTGFYDGKGFAFGHCLHSVVGRVKQPLKDGEKVFISNCEIYNWESLNDKYGFKARNDSELLFRFLRMKGVCEESLEELDGVYAFAFFSDNKLFIARDVIGVKPVWYSHAGGFFFASEKKALEKLGVIDVNELNPRKILVYDFGSDRLELVDRGFFSVDGVLKEGIGVVARKLELLIKEAVSKRIPQRKFGILFSGGIDSTVLALVLKQLGQKFTCYTAVLDDPNLKAPQDLVFAKKVAKELDLNLKVVKVKLCNVERYLEVVVPLIEDSNVVKVGVALTFFAACEQARRDGCKVLFSGLGSEEIFAGYQRHRESYDVNKECLSGLLKMYERDLYRDDVVTMFNSVELRLPFLDKRLVGYALKVPGDFKLRDDQEKFILRVVARNLGLREEFVVRRKKAAQYGSNFHKAIEKLRKRRKLNTKSEYLRLFYPGHNLRLGALISSGKDSVYAMYVMLRQNYSVGCLISIASENPDSYMFHTPTIKLVKLQAEAMGIPLIIHKTKGEKEEELNDLKRAIEKAKEEYGIEGVITGALFSTYQRDRIERICDSLSLKIFSPLWHINQETEMREVVREGFTFIMTKVAAEGLDKGWLNRVVDDEMIDRLVELREKIGFNVAGEGGEFETLVVDGPTFRNKIEIKKSKIVEEDENTATLVVEKAELVDKDKL